MPGAVARYTAYYTELIGRAGFSVAKGAALPFVRAEAVRSGVHGMAYPISTYAPWRGDPDFKRLRRAVRRNTMVDVWRLFELWSLVAELAEIPGSILEVGVWRGGSGALLAERAARLGIREPVFLCDTWEGVVKTGAVDTYYHDGKHDDTSRRVVERLIERLAHQCRAAAGRLPRGHRSIDRGSELSPLSCRCRRLPIGQRRLRLGLAQVVAGGCRRV